MPRTAAPIVVMLFLLLCSTDQANCHAQQIDDIPASKQATEKGRGNSGHPQSASTPLETPQDATPTGMLTLIDGSRVPGALHSTDIPTEIDWLADGFTTPFRFNVQAIEAIKYPKKQISPDGAASEKFAIEFTNGDIVYGDLVAWNAGRVAIETQSLGEITFAADSITQLYRVQENETVLFARFNGLQSWQNTQWNTEGWNEDGNHLATTKPGATLNGDLRVPARSVIDLEISWTGQADFAVAIGTDVTAGTDAYADGWRLETAGQKLIAVRETDDKADLTIVADLAVRKHLQLTLYLDRNKGTLHVMGEDGNVLGQLAIPPAKASDATNESERGIRIQNRGKNLRVERVSVARWLGQLPDSAADGDALVALDDGTFAMGAINSLQSGRLLLGSTDPNKTFDLTHVNAIKFTNPTPPKSPAQCAFFLHSGIRISGHLVSVGPTACTMSPANVAQPTRIPRVDIRSLIIFKHDVTASLKPSVDGRKGRLEAGELSLTGTLEPSSVPDNGDALQSVPIQFRWKPYGSEQFALMSRSIAGNLVYRIPPKVDAVSPQARAQELQRIRLRQQQRGLDFGELFLKRADEVKSATVQRDAHIVHIRSGDVISCRVDRIDEQGVHLSTADSKEGFVSHDEIKAIEYVANSPPPDMESAKRERLLTIPRLQKSAPPTHLLCSHNGDFLRCRLIDANAETIRVEVQLTEFKLPRDRVAQVIWLHPEEVMKSAASDDAIDGTTTENSAPLYEGLVQVLLRDGKRVTFHPLQTTETRISGDSDIVGPCSFALEDIDKLILGNQILTEVTDIAYNKWKLQSAIEPLVTAAMQDGSQPNGSGSPLVGQPAPEVSLMLLDGTPFKLSDSKGKIVVLDFWATWCAPCMQTMPLVEKAIAEFDPDDVQLISINLQESAEQIRPVLERKEMNITVALDIDGVAASRYEAKAIPQLVVVDKDGTVKSLFVGGGSGVVEQMTDAIQALLSEKQSP